MADTAAPGIRETGRRVEQLLDSLASASEPQLRMHAEELVGLLVDLYGAGLSRIVSIVTEHSAGDAARLADLMAADELVSGLLVLHGLHPLDIHTRVQAAIDDVLPSLRQPAPEVELLGVDEAGVVRLRWTAAVSSGSGSSGCGSGGCGCGASGSSSGGSGASGSGSGGCGASGSGSGGCGSGGCGSGGCGSPDIGGPRQLEAAILDAVADATAVQVQQTETRQGPALISVESLFRDRAAVVNG
jgi:hypothetical protein